MPHAITVLIIPYAIPMPTNPESYLLAMYITHTCYAQITHLILDGYANLAYGKL